MKVYLLLVLLLPLCSAKQFSIRCIGEDMVSVNNLQLDCNSKVEQACYTRVGGEKGCTRLSNCAKDGWNCCYTDNCNA